MPRYRVTMKGGPSGSVRMQADTADGHADIMAAEAALRSEWVTKHGSTLISDVAFEMYQQRPTKGGGVKWKWVPVQLETILRT